MSGKNNTAKKAAENKTAAKETAAKVQAPAAPAAPVAAPVAAPKAAPLQFKIGKKQPPKGKRGGGKRGSKYDGGTFLKFAEAPYGSITNGLKAVLNGRGVIMFPHTSGNWCDHNGVQHRAMTAEEKAVFTKQFDTLAEAVAARTITFAATGTNSDDFIGYRQNHQLPEGCKTSKSSVKFHSFLIAENADDIATAVENLNNFKAIPGADLLGIDSGLEFLVDDDGNIEATLLTPPAVAVEAKIAADGTVTEKTLEEENAQAKAEAKTSEEENAQA